MTVRLLDMSVQRILIDAETHQPPWMRLVTAGARTETAFARLGREMTALAELVSPTTKEQGVRRNIVERLECKVRTLWPTASVVPIGSYAQQLYTSSRSAGLFFVRIG